jgi:regulator of RNase E activity RraA
VRIEVPIQVKGLSIQTGDLLHGDENGLIAIPREGIEKLPGIVSDIRSREGNLMKLVRGPEFTLDHIRSRVLE